MPNEKPDRPDFRQEVTNKVIELLERGVAPWQKPWDPTKSAVEMPHNPTTDKPYRGGNAVHLMAQGIAKAFEDPRWLTYKQAQENGWQVRKGEKGTQIEFWQFGTGKAESQSEDEPSKSKSAPLHRIYTVFNAQQIDGIPDWQPKVRQDWEVVQTGENILEASGAKIAHDQNNRAYYSRFEDKIHLPTKSAFSTPADYYGTALHELGHWTGHETRLNRDTLTKSDGFGGPEYAKEELRAELTSLFLAAERGIPHNPEQHAAYVGSWVEVLKKDKNEIFRAAKDASKASEYLLELEHQRENSQQVATLDVDNGTVVITDKQQAVEHRSLVDTAPAASATGKAASLDQAHALVEENLGQGSRAYIAHTDSGHYEGPLIAETSEHLVQQITTRAAAIHERSALGSLALVDPSRPVVIDYANQIASIHAPANQLSRELAELER